ncbi:hypothetical protein FB45DRAFT_829764 [Roridomyces roridus]|uniref:BTB domain-containing protein n=1 Tax=Roridomyces roridus TaxID=1738132 RepID=A0AAD7FR06_9AGAR|nr:hypothetical protein FB45DRAFT_829764 [Roridomyces roridus]
MSDAPPLAKRKRNSTANETATPIRSHIWKPFGDIVLQAESTQFRVSRDVLANQSPVFADMFDVPQPPNEPQIDGCPLVILSEDRAKDWEFLLGILYDNPFEFKKSLGFDMAVALLRLGRKYGIPTAEASAIRRIHSEFPAAFEAWNRNELLLEVEDVDRNLIDILTLAYEFGINTSIPTIAYACLRDKSLEQIFTGVMRTDGSRVLPPQKILQALTIGFERIMRFQHEAYMWMENDTVIPCTLCRQREKCAEARVELHRVVAWNDLTNAPDCFALCFDFEDFSGDFCKPCAIAGKAAHAVSRTKAWQTLPTFFGLPGWKELEDVQ